MIQGLSLGVVGKGRIFDKVQVVDQHAYSRGQFTESVSSGAEWAAIAYTGLEHPLASFVSRFFGSLGRAFADDIEQGAEEKRCIYIVEVEDSSTPDSIRSSILFNSSQNSSLSDTIQGVPKGYIMTTTGLIIPKEKATLEEMEIWEAKVKEANIDELDKSEFENVFSLPQACNDNINAGSDVIISYHSWGAAIWPASKSE